MACMQENGSAFVLVRLSSFWVRLVIHARTDSLSPVAKDLW